MNELDENVLEELYSWVDKIPLTRPKKDLKRDFSDGVLVAEVVHHYLPKLVDLHNYVPTLKETRKITNWNLLNRKVFRKIGFEVTDEVIKNIVTCKQTAIEKFLLILRSRLAPGDDSSKEKKSPEALTISLGDVAVRTESQNVPKRMTTDHAVSVTVSPPTHPAAVPVSSNHSAGNTKMDMVPREIVEQKQQELRAKEELIEVLNTKVKRLEHLLHLKDIRIEDLQVKIAEAESRSLLNQ